MTQYLDGKIRGDAASYMFKLPASIPANQVYSQYLYMRASSTGYAANSSSFFTSLAAQNAAAEVTVSDTWTAVCDISGAGFLGFAVSTAHSSAHVPELRITVDGISRTITGTATPGNYRIFAGSLWLSNLVSTTPVVPFNQYYDYGFNPKIGSETLRTLMRAHVLTTRQMISVGMPVLRFESNLKVEAKTDINGLSSPNSYAGAAYELDW